MKWTQEELEQLYQQVNAKAIENEEFRKELLADPKAILEREAGRKLPDDFNLKIVESDSGYAASYIVPDFVQGELDAQELGADALGKVSGGNTPIFVIVSVCSIDGPCGVYYEAPECPGKVIRGDQ